MIGGIASLHPIAGAIYFSGMLILIMWLTHPVYLFTALTCMVLMQILLGGAEQLQHNLRWYFLMGTVIVIMNPLFSSRGATILVYFRNRPVTLESLVYGLVFAVTLITMLICFQVYQRVIPVDKFLYLTSSVIPRTAFVVAMTLQFVPLLHRRLSEIQTVAKAQGQVQTKGRIDRIRQLMDMVNGLLMWTIEESLHTASSMRSRGYGTGPRSSFVPYAMGTRDIWIIAAMLIMGFVILIGSVLGQGRMEFFPEISGLSFHTAHFLCFLLWSGGPVIMEIGERIQWRIIRSKT